MLIKRYTATKSWAFRHPRRFFVYTLGIICAGIILFQLFYPTTSLVPSSKIEGVKVGGLSKADAIKKLDETFNTSKVGLYFDNSDSAFLKATPVELGISASNKDRIEGIDYPWYARFVPTSIFWFHIFTDNFVHELTYQRNAATLSSYISNTFGNTCHLDIRNASAEVKDKTIQVVEGFSGGDCEFSEVSDDLSIVKPTEQGAKITMAGTATPPAVTTQNAQDLVNRVSEAIKDGISINDGKALHKIPKELLISWLDFAVTDGKLDYSFNTDRAASYLGERVASVVEKPTGVMTITMKDYVESSRQTGQSGVVFNEPAMLASMKATLDHDEKVVAVEVNVIPPTVKYVRTSSPPDVALTALIKRYADTHPGTYSVSLQELSGKRRNASYQANTVLTTASTYKMFIAYSTLLRIESGQWHWTDKILNDENLTSCFNDMIQLSDNDCGVALLRKIGYKNATNEAHDLGAVNTSFLVSTDIKSSAADEALLLSLLQSGQLLTQQSSRDIMINAMKKNVYRQGIPAGIPSMTVADKVGFLDDYLHDAAIVYTPQGPYVLVIMTQDASWKNIAQLTSQIETLRAN